MNLTYRAFLDSGTIRQVLFVRFDREKRFENLLCTNSYIVLNWHTFKAMQSRVKMNDDYIALDCALLACRETGIEAWLRKKNKKKSEKKGG